MTRSWLDCRSMKVRLIISVLRVPSVCHGATGLITRPSHPHKVWVLSSWWQVQPGGQLYPLARIHSQHLKHMLQVPRNHPAHAQPAGSGESPRRCGVWSCCGQAGLRKLYLPTGNAKEIEKLPEYQGCSLEVRA